jgi:hypothetical protein
MSETLTSPAGDVDGELNSETETKEISGHRSLSYIQLIKTNFVVRSPRDSFLGGNRKTDVYF